MDDSRPFADLTLTEFVDRLASDAPVPGGGSASAVAASLAAGLVAMVAGLSRRAPLVQHSEVHDLAEATGRRLATRLLELADEDAAAYATFAAALKLPRSTPEESDARAAAKRAAAFTAAEVPLRCVEACLEVVQAAELLAGRCNLNASSDLTVASLLAEAAAKGAAANVRVNLPSVGDDIWAVETERKVDGLLRELTVIATSCREVVATGRMREPAGLIAAP
ncbi:MAG TPA: cyclodeaminase/cyclohydrolase family protein [Candidatus Acidoferrales bacterium]|jgi:formiminotetrahydrofolate cyclodeaminase|nr:cyclodeaminase/cyclohydrolase family protein [Candidatus Acidoferrales bacterium]